MATPTQYLKKQDFSYKGSKGGIEYTYILRVFEVSYSIENNTSRIFIQAILQSNYSGDSFWKYYTTVTGSIDNVQKFSSREQRSCSGKGEHVYHEWAGDISHNADGTKTIEIDGKISQDSPDYFPSSGISITNQTMVLNTIPRASKIDSVSGDALDSAVTVAITRASSNFVHKVEYDFNGSGWKTVSLNAGTSCSFTPKASDLAKYIPTTDKGTLTVRVTTFNGSKQIGSAVTDTTTLSLPKSYQPYVELGYGINNPTSIREWAIAVKGHSSLVFEMVGATASIGSEIASYSITGGGYSSNKSTLTTGVVNIHGGYTFTAKITDKRGRTATDTVDVFIENYFTPSITLEAYRCNKDGIADSNGTYLRITSSFNYAKIGKNTVSYEVYCNGASNETFENGKPFTLNANCSIASSYIATASISDVLTVGNSVTVSIPTAVRPLTIKANGKGVAVGKVAELDNTFDVEWRAVFRNNIILESPTKVFEISVDDNGVIKATQINL